MDYYIHLFPGGQRDITNRLDDNTGQDWTLVFRPTRPGMRGLWIRRRPSQNRLS
jgi:hypothetical protein